MSQINRPPKKLYMANTLKALNEKVESQSFSSLSKHTIEQLIKSSEKILGEASKAADIRDEELAYLYYMRYFSIIKCIQSNQKYKDNKKFYTSLVNQSTPKSVIKKAEELGDRLKQRYKDESVKNDDQDIKSFEIVKKKIEEKKNRKETDEKSKISLLRMQIDSVDVNMDGFILCQKLLSLTKERVSSFLVVDVRPKDYYDQSRLKLSNYIHIPEDLLMKKGFTPEKIGRSLEEGNRLLWNRREGCDYIIICDETTDTQPFPAPITNLIDSIQNWDPGKHYKTMPVVLKGGLELLRCTYPFLVCNPSFNPAKDILATNGLVSSSSLLSFDFPNLDTSINETPSEDIKPNEVFDYPKFLDVQSAQVKLPDFNRNLKPVSDNMEDERTEENSLDSLHRNSNYKTPSCTLPDKAVNNTTKSYGSLMSDKTSNSSQSEVYFNLPSASEPLLSNKFDPNSSISDSPSVPSRTLKPKDLLDSFKTKKKEFDEEQLLLEEAFKKEEESIKILEDIETSQKDQVTTADEDHRLQLADKENQLRTEMSRITGENEKLYQNYEKVFKENEELRKLFSKLLEDRDLNDQMKRIGITDSALTVKEARELKELKAAQEKEEQRKLMLQQVGQLRKQKNQMVNKLHAKDEKEKNERLRAAERNSRNREHSRPPQDSEMITPPIKSKTRETYTTRLRSSPVRGSNIKRSHSALDLSKLQDDNSFDSPYVKSIPSVDRSMKPLDTPRRRSLKAARQRDFEPKHGSVGYNKTGLKNLGNTCYMNSIIQCLSCTEPLARYFYDDDYSEDLNIKSQQQGDVAEEFVAVVRALWCGNYRSISMWDLKKVIGMYHRPFQGSDQHDSHEFLLKLMDWLHNDLNKVTVKLQRMEEQNFDTTPDYAAAQAVIDALKERDRSIMRDLFYGLHRSVIICGTCGHRSLTFEQFSVLTVSFPENGKCTLKEMLHDYYQRSNIEYKCSKCNKLRNCTRSLDIWKLPPVLVIHLNRFELDVLTKKKQNFVDFPLDNLDFSSYVADYNAVPTYFNLYGVSNHYGTIDGGHYTAFCKSPRSKLWHKYDDHEVYELPRESVKTSAAYILFYESVR